MNDLTYPGGELELFAQACRWKQYWSGRLRPFLGTTVLEVGAGIGANTLLLRRGREQRWVCLEPDPALAATLRQRIAARSAGEGCEILVGTLASLPGSQMFDTILYIDVLEHIHDDRAELAAAAQRLAPGGHLIVLAPAHQWLFSPFDQAIGHYRRYTRRQLIALTPTNLRHIRSFYLDSVGLVASAANRLALRQSLPTARQLAWWDRVMVPCSRCLDPLTGYRCGKTVVCIWRREQ